MSMCMSTTKIVKKRNWAFVLYPESAPDNWIDILTSTGLQCAISPLHNFDVNPDGEVKKEHYHIILCYSGPTSFNVVNNLCQSLNQPIPIPLEQIKGYYRYFTHKDNPEKFQYRDEDIKTVNGFSIIDFVELSKSECLRIKKELIQLCIDKAFVEYSVLMNYLLFNGTDEEFDVASSNTIFFNSYLSSCRFISSNTDNY